MIASLETPSLKDFFVMIGRGLGLGLAVAILLKLLPALNGDLFGSFVSDLIGLAIIYPLVRRLGFDFRKAGDYLAAFRGEFRTAFKYYILLFAVLFAGHYAYAMALAPWDLAWTNKLLYWLEGTNNPAVMDSRISYLIGNPVWIPGFVFSICIAPPLIEEFLFRRWLYVALRKRMTLVYAIALNGAFFGLLHGADFFPTAICGFFACWAYERTGKIEIPILMHVLINATNLAMIFGDKLGL